VALQLTSSAEFQRVCGIPFGGLHLATAFSLRSRTPLIYVHPAKERNGSRVFVEGLYTPEETVLLIDDLVTSGGGIVETGEFLKVNAALDVKDVLVLLDRQEGAKELLKARGSRGLPIGVATYIVQMAATGLEFAHGRPGGAVIPKMLDTLTT